MHDRVAELLIEILDSFDKLEVLLRLARAELPVHTGALAAEIGGEEAAIAEALAALVAQGLIARTSDGYTLVREGAWAAHVAALVAMYDADRMEVVVLMAKAAMERIRVQAARAFADAFVIRTKKGDRDG